MTCLTLNMIYIILIILLLNCEYLNTISGGQYEPNSTGIQNRNRSLSKKTVVAVIFSNTTINIAPNEKNKFKSCKWLRGLKKQKKLCQNREGFAQVLQNARELAIAHCDKLFRYEGWNCSYSKSLFQNVYRETAFMYAISASAIFFSTAKACSSGSVKNCFCGEKPKQKLKVSTWQWSGCSDNTKEARRMTNKFLKLSRPDGQGQLLNNNTEIGLNVVKENQTILCTCHGLSGSCTLKTCRKIIKPFSVTAHKLKERYYTALKVDVDNRQNTATASPSGGLLYLTPSPNFCQFTAGRRCKDEINCSNLCCARGFTPKNVIVVTDKCKCRWEPRIVNITCDKCEKEEEYLYCK